MRLFNAYIKNSNNGAIEDLVLIKNGTSYLALFFSGIWFLYHKMWKESFILAVIVTILLKEEYIAGNDVAAFVTFLCLALLIAVNANYWYSKSLEKRGYNFSGCVFAKNKEMAKLRFIEGYLAGHPNDSELFSASILDPKGKTKNHLIPQNS